MKKPLKTETSFSNEAIEDVLREVRKWLNTSPSDDTLALRRIPCTSGGSVVAVRHEKVLAGYEVPRSNPNPVE